MEINPSEDDLHYLTRGSKVEVLSTDIGLKGSYFTATIVDHNPDLPNSFTVEFDNLHDEECSNKLQEVVQASCIRPIPPSIHESSSFQVNDVVDTYKHDGWWVGVVEKIFMDTGTGDLRYGVRTQAPLKYSENDRSNLRTHFDWVGHCRKWVSPSMPKKEIILEPKIENDSCGSNLLGMEKTDDRRRGQCITESRKSSLEKGFCTEKVSLDVVTPRKRQHVSKSKQVNSRQGTLLSRESLLQEIILEPKIENDSCGSNLLGMEKMDDRRRGQCITESRKGLLEKGFCTEKVSLDVVTPRKRQQEESTHGRCLKKLKIICGGADESRTMPAALENEGVVFCISGPQELTCSKQVEVDEPPSAEESLELVQHLHGGSSVPEKNRERQTERIVLRFGTERGQTFLRTIHSDKEHIDKVGATYANECTAAESDMPDTGEVEATTPISPQCENQIQHSGLQELTAKNTVEVSSEAEMAIVGFGALPLNMAESSNSKGTKEAVDVNEGLPFVKSLTAVWKALESSEVFQKTPQKPHFRPLQYEAELSREALAIANMSRFFIVVDGICKLRHKDPQSKFDMILEALLELKEHGFDVEPLERRLSKLLETKASIAQLEVQVKETEIRVKEKSLENVRVEEKIHELAKKMDEVFKKLKDIEEQKKDVQEQKVDGDSKIAMLKSTLDNTSEQLQAAHLKFKKLAGGSSENE